MPDRISSPHSNLEQTLALQTLAIDALVAELRATRVAAERPSVISLWHTVVAVVVAVTCFAGLWVLVPTGLVVIK